MRRRSTTRCCGQESCPAAVGSSAVGVIARFAGCCGRSLCQRPDVSFQTSQPAVPQRLLSFVVGARTHAGWHQAVVGSGERRSPERPLYEVPQPPPCYVATRPASRATRTRGADPKRSLDSGTWSLNRSLAIDSGRSRCSTGRIAESSRPAREACARQGRNPIATESDVSTTLAMSVGERPRGGLAR